MRSAITIGFSVNAETSFEYEDLPGEKGILKSFSVSLAGSSANVARCLTNLDHNPLLIVPSEDADSDNAHELRRALQKAGLPNVCINMLDQTPIAVYPIGDRRGSTCVLYGCKGVLTSDPELLQDALQRIAGLDGTWRITTGIDDNFLPLANQLLGEEKGFRIFGPHHTLCRNQEFSNFTLPGSPLSRCDLLILNKIEFEALGRTMEEIHGQGVSVVVVTEDAEGGKFSLCNLSTQGKPVFGRYEAVNPIAATELFPVGAGDWFLGALTSHLVHYVENRGEGASILSVPFEVLRVACNFAAKVASQKVTMKGGSNGPTLAEII